MILLESVWCKEVVQTGIFLAYFIYPSGNTISDLIKSWTQTKSFSKEHNLSKIFKTETTKLLYNIHYPKRKKKA